MSSYMERFVATLAVSVCEGENREEELNAILTEGGMFYAKMVSAILNCSPRSDWPIIITTLRQSADLMETELIDAEKLIMSQMGSAASLIKVPVKKENEE